MGAVPVEITQAAPNRLSALASVLGRAFVDEPMMRWPLGDHGDTEDGGRRYDAFWEWVESKIPHEPLWHLDSVGVDRDAQGRGIGSALIDFGLARARADKAGVFLETGTPRDVPYYERFGFRVVAGADAPDGGPHNWFMRWDP